MPRWRAPGATSSGPSPDAGPYVRRGHLFCEVLHRKGHLRLGESFVARADLVAERVSPERPIGLNYTTRPISLVFADEMGNPWQQMLYPVAAYPDELDKLAASSPSTTRLTSTGQIKIRYKDYWYEGTLDYLVIPNQQSRSSDLQWINTDDLNGDGCNDSWIYYPAGEKQALLKVCPKR